MSERRPLIAGNWKMHTLQAEARELARAIRAGLPASGAAEVALAPPYTALAAVAQEIAGSPLRLAGQDAFWERQGAYTGAISPWMLADLGCTYVILGHSERRQHFHETDATVQRKLQAALAAGLMVILCVGETLAEREAGQTLEVVHTQLQGCLKDFPAPEWNRLVVAYEPVWAIGTGRTATPDQAQEVHAFIRGLLPELGASAACRILYGGSVTPENAAALLAQPDIDGALVGGASLKADSFLAIVAAAG